jgi:UDP-N-acetyl-alpha-D-muramoyl-L-alanyl-L-glutamate epimerase
MALPGTPFPGTPLPGTPFPGTPPQSPARGQVFRYAGYATDPATATLSCHYELDGREFTERVTLPGAEGNPRWHTEAAQAAARLLFLLAGVSYYKTAAPPVIDLGETALTAAEESFLRDFYLHGLGEFAYRNTLDLTSIDLQASRAPSQAPVPPPPPASDRNRALVPFGGGIDSIVTVEQVRQNADVALFVVSRPGDLFDAIEEPAAVTGLPIVRAEREIDPQLLRSAELGFLNGHVPVTGILSAIAILAAVLEDRDAVVMSNEWSASVPTLEYQGRPVNHQYSKSEEFEAAFRNVLKATPGPMPEYFSWLRDRTELWVGQEFAKLTPYHSTFRSCNKAFYTERARRFTYWCGECDKCAFIDLILAPFLPADALRQIFAVTGEPLENTSVTGKFRSLLGAAAKPFECVGEVTECRAAALLAARRADRDPRTNPRLLTVLAAEVRTWPDAPSAAEVEAMLRPVGRNFIPNEYRDAGS